MWKLRCVLLEVNSEMIDCQRAYAILPTVKTWAFAGGFVIDCWGASLGKNASRMGMSVRAITSATPAGSGALFATALAHTRLLVDSHSRLAMEKASWISSRVVSVVLPTPKFSR